MSTYVNFTDLFLSNKIKMEIMLLAILDQRSIAINERRECNKKSLLFVRQEELVLSSKDG